MDTPITEMLDPAWWTPWKMLTALFITAFVIYGVLDLFRH